MKFRDWFTFKGIKAEIGRVSWLSKKELIKNSSVVLIFCFLFGVYFYASDMIIAFILRVLGMK